MGKLIGLVILVGGFLVWRRWRKLESDRARRKFAFQTIVAGLLILIVLLAIAGKIHPLGAVFAALLGLVKVGMNLLIRWLPLLARLYGANYAQPRKLSTETLEVEINFATGKVTGKVTSGSQAGRSLDDLSDDELKELLAQCKSSDKKSAYLLQMYMAQRFRGGSGGDTAAPAGTMTLDEAADILGVSTEADKEEIAQAHRRLIGRVHPDKGGNDYLASLLNRARDRLLDK